MIRIEKIQQRFPDLNIQLLQGGYGCNIYLPNKTIITVYFKKEIYCNNRKNKWRNFLGYNELFIIIEETIAPVPTPRPAIIEEITDKGTQACIDHLEDKYQAFIKIFPEDHRTATMIKTLKSELYQYL